MSSSEAVEVEARVIEDGGALSVRFSPATIEADFGALEERVGEIVGRYGSLVVDPDDEGQVKGARETRAYLRSVKAQIEERRKAVEAEYSRPLQEFKDRVRLVTGRLDGAIGVVDAQVKEGERRYRERKRAHLEGI